jgi:miniconductance mechanosensitive channel
MSFPNFNLLVDSLERSLPSPALILLSLLIITLISWLSYLILKLWLITFIHKLLKKTYADWDESIIETALLQKCARILPPLIFYLTINYIPSLSDNFRLVIQNLSLSFLALFASSALMAFLDTFHYVYKNFSVAKDRPIKSFIQLLKIVIFIVTTIILISLIINRSPVLLLSGLGALAAVALIVFKDTLLSLVASIQITSLGIVKAGDWIEMPSCGADGDVIDVQLHTVRVQNWDKTISTIPTHRLVSESFKNWRGMNESGVRRIKRSINIDLSSVSFLDVEQLSEFKEFALLRSYIGKKEEELIKYNQSVGKTSNINLRRLTNLGTYRAYILSYLKNHPGISQSSTLLVRQLPPASKGIPIEIYAFTKTTEWVSYEDIQSDIFDHLLAIVEAFKLKVYQEPSGHDFRHFKN